MVRLLLVLLLAGPLARPCPAAGGADPIQTAYERWAADDVRGALELLAGHVRAGALRLPSLEEQEALALADDLELALVILGRMAEPLDNRPLVRRLLAGVQVERVHGMLASRLDWVRGDSLEDPSLLLAWSFVGPFDNERGRGMGRATPAEQDPRAASYAGKVRPVAWRALPSAPPRDGVLRFGPLLDPSRQVCVVARTWVRSDVGRDVLLLAGMTEELRVWSQGRAVYEALEGFDFGVDGHAVTLRLEAGWNELVVKVGSGDQASPALRARLVEPVRGRPLQLEQSASVPEGVEPRQLEDPGRSLRDAPPRVARPGAWRRVAGGSTAQDRFRLAVLQRDGQAATRSERPGRAAAQAAATARPGVLHYELTYLETLREAGALATEEDTNPWRNTLDELLARHGDLARLLRQRAEHAAYGQGLMHLGLEYNARALAANPASVPARLQRAQLLEAMGQDARALHLRRQLARDPAALDWASLGQGLSSLLPVTDPAYGPLLEGSAAAGHPPALEAKAELRRLEQSDRSEATLRADLALALNHHPWSTQPRLGTARTALAMGHQELALEVLDEALALAPDRAPLERLRASALWRLDQRAEAVASLERALELDFTDEGARRLLELWRESGAEAFYAPWDEELQAILARRAADAPVEADSASREVLLDRRVVEVFPDGSAKRYRRSVQRVLSEAGAAELDQRAWRAWPGQEEVRVLAARVLHPDGRVVEASTGRSGRRGYVAVDLPPLAPGDVVDLVWQRDQEPSAVFGNYFGLDAALVAEPSLPLRESELVLIWPEALPLYLHQRNLEGLEPEVATLEGERQMRRWVLEHQAPLRVEPLMPPTVESGPRVQASTYRTWEDFGHWWWNLIDDEIRVSPEMAAKVAELCAEADTPAERLRAIYDFVVTDIRYNAWEFGIHGYEPYSTPVIFSRGFGDCKDKAILLRAMLSVVGIEAWPVLIRMEDRRYEEDLSLPLVSHFNHCIAYVPEQEGIEGRYLDGTARLHPLEVLPDGDGGAKVVVVEGERVREARVPFPTPTENVLRRRVVVDLRQGDGPRVRLSLDPSGRFDPPLRHQFTGSDEQRLEAAENLLSSLLGPLRGDVTAAWPDFEDLGSPPRLELEGAPESIARPTQAGYELPTSLDPLELLRSRAGETERSTDLLLGMPWSLETELVYELPDNASVPRLPEPLEVSTEDAQYSRSVERTEGGLRVVERYAMGTHRVPAERYAAFRELARKVDQAQAQHVEVEVQP